MNITGKYYNTNQNKTIKTIELKEVYNVNQDKNKNLLPPTCSLLDIK